MLSSGAIKTRITFPRKLKCPFICIFYHFDCVLTLFCGYSAFLRLMLDFTTSCRVSLSLSLKCALGCFSFCLCDTHKQSPTLGCIVKCDHPRAAIDSTREWQQAAGLLPSNGELFVCVFIWSVRPERPSVAECPPQPEQTRQDRTSHFLQPPLVKVPIFTPVALELLCLSLWATSWWHSGQQNPASE